MKVLGYGFIVMLLLVCLFGCTHSLRSPQHKIALIHSYNSSLKFEIMAKQLYVASQRVL